MRVPKGFSGPTRLAGLGMGDVPPASLLVVHPPEAGLPGLFAPEIAELAIHHLDYGRFRQDRAVVPKGVRLDFGCPGEAEAPPDLTLLYFPKEKPLAAYLLGAIHRRVGPGARVLIVGPNQGGIRSSDPLVERHLGPVLQRRSGRHARLLEVTAAAGAEPFDGDRRFAVTVGGETLEIASRPGVFSHGELDPGTRMLLESLEDDVHFDRALDLGCGCGVVGAYLGRRVPGGRVDCVDGFALALLATRETLELNRIPTASVFPSDGFSDVSGTYDLILSNPPFHAGLRTDPGPARKMLAEAAGHLVPGGRLRVVANRFLDYLTGLREAFDRVAVIAEDGRFRVIEAREPRAVPVTPDPGPVSPGHGD